MDRLKYVAVLLMCCVVPLQAGIVAKSSITQCVGSTDVKTGAGQPCSKMLVVALTITGDEVYTATRFVIICALSMLLLRRRGSRGTCRQT